MKKAFQYSFSFMFYFRLAALFTLICVILLLSAPVRAVEFRNKGLKLVETKTGLVPELCAEDLPEWVILPGTRIKAGSFRYLYDFLFTTSNMEEKKVEEETCKAGLLFDDALYYVESSDIGGDTNFGVYKDYFLMDSFAYGASHNRTMFLFRYDKTSAQLLDVIGNASIAHDLLDFTSAYTGYGDMKYGYLGDALKGSMWMKLGDFDHDDNPEIEIVIFREDYDETVFDLFFEIKDDRLSLDLNPALYRPLFEKERKKAKGKRFKPDAYYIYGFLAGEFTLDRVKAMLKDELGVAETTRIFMEEYNVKYDQYKGVVPLLESRDKWNYKFHHGRGGKPEDLIKYEIKRR